MTATPPAEAIERSADVCGGKPRVAGTRIRVQDVYVWHELHGRSVDEIVASFPQLTHAQVHSALAYFFSHRDEIRNDVADDERDVESLKAVTVPGPFAIKNAILFAAI